MNDEWVTADVDIDAPEAGAFLNGIHVPSLGRVREGLLLMVSPTRNISPSIKKISSKNNSFIEFFI
jgi:hypothetical protein